MDGGAWWAAVHGVAKSQTLLSDYTFTFHFHALEKEMATHSSVLSWRIPGMGEPGGLHYRVAQSRTRLKRLSSSIVTSSFSPSVRSTGNNLSFPLVSEVEKSTVRLSSLPEESDATLRCIASESNWILGQPAGALELLVDVGRPPNTSKLELGPGTLLESYQGTFGRILNFNFSLTSV